MNRIVKILPLTTLVIVAIVLALFGLVLLQDYVEDECEKKVGLRIEDRNDLVSISYDEKISLGIDEHLTPTKYHYEVRKCARSKWRYF